MQQAEKRIKELEKNIDSEYKDVILQYEQKLQAETKSKAKSEKEMKLMENKVCEQHGNAWPRFQIRILVM